MPYVGEIRAFTSKLPEHWLPCDGRLLPFDTYPALGAAIATSYDGPPSGVAPCLSHRYA